MLTETTLMEIFKFLPAIELKNCQLVNRYFNQILTEETFWSVRFRYRYGETEAKLFSQIRPPNANYYHWEIYLDHFFQREIETNPFDLTVTESFLTCMSLITFTEGMEDCLPGNEIVERSLVLRNYQLFEKYLSHLHRGGELIFSVALSWKDPRFAKLILEHPFTIQVMIDSAINVLTVAPSLLGYFENKLKETEVAELISVWRPLIKRTRDLVDFIESRDESKINGFNQAVIAAYLYWKENDLTYYQAEFFWDFIQEVESYSPILAYQFYRDHPLDYQQNKYISFYTYRTRIYQLKALFPYRQSVECLLPILDTHYLAEVDIGPNPVLMHLDSLLQDKVLYLKFNRYPCNSPFLLSLNLTEGLPNLPIEVFPEDNWEKIKIITEIDEYVI